MANTLETLRVSGTQYTLIDSTAIHSLDGYYTSGQTNDAITAATAALAQTIAEQGYQTSGDVQSAISGKADVSALENYFGAVNYDSNTKRINFYNTSTGGTVMAYVDATDFVKDGFLSSVTIDNRTISGESQSCLVFVWNTDAGIQETDIPLTNLFDPSNYWTSGETQTAIDAATSGKTDSTAFTAHTADTTVHVTTAEKNTWNAKQDTLSAGTGVSITNNVISLTNTPYVSGTTLIIS